MNPREITVKNLLFLACGFSVVMLSTALVAQYGFGLHPCHLCMVQRYPYAAVAVLALLAAFFLSPRAQFYIACLCAALFTLDAGIAFYHTGVELHWFPGPSGCTNTSTGGQTLEEMRRQLMEAPLVSCDQAMATVLGLSLAAWNGLAAMAAAIAATASLVMIRKRHV